MSKQRAIIGSKFISNGYVSIKTKDGWMPEHRYVMEQYLGRKLLSTEDVHHGKKGKCCNDLDNLTLITHAEHQKLHAKGRVFSEEHKRKISEAKKNPSKETRRKISEALKKRIISNETRIKLSEAVKNSWKTRSHKNKILTKKDEGDKLLADAIIQDGNL